MRHHPRSPSLPLQGSGRRSSRGKRKPPSKRSCLGTCSSGVGSAARRGRSAPHACGGRAISVRLIGRLLGLSRGRIRGGRAGDLCSPADHCRRPRAEAVQQESPQAVIARVRRTDAEGLLCEAWWEHPLWEACWRPSPAASTCRGRRGAVRPPTQVFADLRGPADASWSPPCWQPSRATPRSSTGSG